MCYISRTSISPIKNITSHRISSCSVAFIEIKFQQKLCFNNQVLMLPSNVEPSDVECPDSECAQAYIVSKSGQQ